MTERTHGGSVAAARLAAESACGAYYHGAVRRVIPRDIRGAPHWHRWGDDALGLNRT